MHYVPEKIYENTPTSTYVDEIFILKKFQKNPRLQFNRCIHEEIKSKLASESSSNDIPVILHSTKSRTTTSLGQLHFKEESLNPKN